LCALTLVACGTKSGSETPTAEVPAGTPTPEEKATPAVIDFNQFGFVIHLDGVFSINTSPLLDTLPNEKSGSMLWGKGAGRYALSWRPPDSFKSEDERNNQRLVSLDRSINLLQTSNPNLIVSEMSQGSTENMSGFDVVYKTFQVKARDMV